jgi:tetratricopeptide (TPR) repeat protein
MFPPPPAVAGGIVVDLTNTPGVYRTDTAPSEVDRLMSEALQLHQQGRLAQAEPLYRQVLVAAPRHAEALHMLGVVALQQRRPDEAERVIGEALAIRPDHAEALNNRAGALRALGRLEEALTSYDRALAIKPSLPQMLNNRGNVLKDLGRSEDALADYDAALAIRPSYAEALNNRAIALSRLQRHEEALASCDQALAIKPDYPEALNNRGNTLFKLGRLEKALASYDQAIELKPDYVEALNNRGNSLQGLGRLEEALASCDRALAIKPDDVEVLNNRGNMLRARFEAALSGSDNALSANPNQANALHNRGNALLGLRRLEEALASYDRALAIKPDHADALNNRAHVLYQLWRPEEALADCNKALSVRPDHAEGLNNRGVMLQALRRLEEALASYAAAAAVKPGFADAHFNEALCRLSVGDFATGWQKYEWRWRLQSAAQAKRVFPKPLWLGKEDLSGKTVFLHAEQGLGDTLQFCRYVPAVAAKGATVILEVPAPLKSLLRTLPGVERVVSEYDPSRPFDFHCPLMSLPLAFGTRLETIPAPVPYLWANPFRAAAWRERLEKLGGIKVGLVWGGSARLDNPSALLIDRRRSMRLQQMWSFGAIEGVTLVSLQKGDPASQTRPPPSGLTIHDWTDDLADFADTAALIDALDLVISVDTSVAHLAGALGKPVWVLNRHDCCWRWLLNREDTPWYPTMRLFTQPSPGDWAGLVRRVSGELRDFASDRLAASARDAPRVAALNSANDTPDRTTELIAGARGGDRPLDYGLAFRAFRLTE